VTDPVSDTVRVTGAVATLGRRDAPRLPTLASGAIVSRPETMRSTLSHALRAGAVGLVVASAAAAQDALPIPAIRELRFEEDWSRLAAHEERIANDPWLSWKFAPLSNDRRTWVSVGGSLRVRGEGRRETGLGTTPTGIVDEDAYLGRALLHADLHVVDGFRVFVEGRAAFVSGRDSQFGDQPTDADEFDLQNAFVESTARITDHVAGLVRAGRLELALGSQRLVSPVDWRNSRTNFDGVSVVLGAPGFVATAFGAAVVEKDVDGFDSTDADTLFWGTHAEWFDDRVAFESYWFGRKAEFASVAGESGEEDRNTVGVGATIPFFFGSRANAEGAYQFGEVGDARIRAFMYALGVTRPLTRALSLRAGATYASGDDALGDGFVGTFDQLYGDSHRYHGILDAVSGQNLVDVEVGLDYAASRALTFSLAYHRFLRADKSDGLYDALGANTLPATSRSRRIGDEIDFVARYRIAPFWSFDLGAGYLMADDYLADVSTGEDALLVFASVAFTF
jgi:hypothetical protein